MGLGLPIQEPGVRSLAQYNGPEGLSGLLTW